MVGASSGAAGGFRLERVGLGFCSRDAPWPVTPVPPVQTRGLFLLFLVQDQLTDVLILGDSKYRRSIRLEGEESFVSVPSRCPSREVRVVLPRVVLGEELTFGSGASVLRRRDGRC